MMQLFHDDAYTLRILAIGLLIIAFMVWHFLTAHRRILRFRQGIYRGFDISDHRRSGDVHVVFHTYSGLLVYVYTETHDLWRPEHQADDMLLRLHLSNLRRGFFAYGALLIPIVSYINYLIQRSRIRRQRKELFASKKEALPEF